ncbi:MAG: tyrosine recombinase XerC [Clostridia bacterium]|nr:tyrosine recombinase XerC [Clostridia bacterium]
MAVLTLHSPEYQTFPPIIKDYANYVSVIKGNSEKTVCEYLLDIRTFFRYIKARNSGSIPSKEEFIQISISDLTLDDIKKIGQNDILEYLVFTRSERSNGSTTRMRKLSALRSFFNYLCNKKHLLENNPTVDVDSPKPAKTLPKYMSYEESLRLLETIRNDIASPTSTRDFAIVVLFLNTGMRLSELVGLNLQSFSQDLATVRVLGKGNKERLIYLNDFARSAVSEYLQVRLDPKFIRTSDKAFFLSSREQRISNKTVQWMVQKYLKLSGLGYKGFSVHKLRHTAATLMYQSGKVDIRVLKDVLGHEQLNTTQIYTHVVDRNREQAVESNPLAGVKLKRPKV